MSTEFQTKTFSDVLLKIIGGGTPSKAIDNYWNGDIPWVSVKDMTDEMIYLTTTQDYITEEGLKNSSSNLIQSNSIIISTRMGLGRCFINKVEMAINQDLKALIPNENIVDKYYLFYFLKFKAEYLISIGSGTTVKGIRLEDLKKIEILLPSIKTQQKIVKLISKYDNLIENNNTRIKLLENMAEELYKEWFVRLRFPNYQNTKIVDGLPDGWEEKEIKNTCNISGGGTPSTKENLYWENGIINWYTPSDLSNMNSMYSLESKNKITIQGLNNSSARLLDSDSFMMTSRATIGLFAISKDKFCTNQGFINVTPFNNYEKYYLLYTLKNRVEEFKLLGTGATFPEISKSIFNKLKIIVPLEIIIKEFDKIIRPIIDKLFILTESNQNLKETRDLLLPRLISGKLDIKDMDIV